MARSNRTIVDALMARHGRTFASQAGIRIARNTPAPLFQLLCLSLLFSARISADIAVAAMQALRSSGWTTPKKMVDAGWRARVDVLNKSGYARYDERTSSMLEDASQLLLDKYRGDLRRLREQAEFEPEAERRLLTEFKGIGDVGVDIFYREVQGVWSEITPFVDKKAMQGAKQLGLPDDARAIARLVEQKDLPRLVAALVRVQLEGDAETI
ncbi:MAG: hypothetical protein ACNA7J_07060, partial [Wenzhouxiangella sp.]